MAEAVMRGLMGRMGLEARAVTNLIRSRRAQALTPPGCTLSRMNRFALAFPTRGREMACGPFAIGDAGVGCELDRRLRATKMGDGR